MTTIVRRLDAFFAFACFTVAWVVAIGNDETRSESWGHFPLRKFKKKNPKKASRAVTDFTAFYVNVDGPFSVTPPIHTHYYTPRDHSD
jgi:hypothetical protein